VLVSAPAWVTFATDRGAEVYEAGEHGQWTVIYGSQYVTDADCADGELAIGDVTGPADDPAFSDVDEVDADTALAQLLAGA
jgi:hypothetical protein